MTVGPIGRTVGPVTSADGGGIAQPSMRTAVAAPAATPRPQTAISRERSREPAPVGQERAELVLRSVSVGRPHRDSDLPPPNTQLPAGWESIPLDVGRLPQDQSLWSPWAGPLPKDGPLILLDRYSRKLSIAAGGAPARVMDYAQLLPPIPPYATGPFPSGPCATTRFGLWGQRESVPAEPQVVTQNEVQQIDLYVRSGESVVQFMGVLNCSWSQLRFLCSDPVNYDGPFLWRDAGVTNSGIVWQSRLTTISW